MTNTATPAPGTVLLCSWGYEQTNADFYRVHAAKGQFVTLQRLRTVRDYQGDMRGKATPGDPIPGKPLIRRKWVTGYSAEGFCKIESYSYARPWDGRPASFTEYA